MTDKEIISQAINILEKDAAILSKLSDSKSPFLIFTKSQSEILETLSKLSYETIELLKTVKL